MSEQSPTALPLQSAAAAASDVNEAAPYAPDPAKSHPRYTPAQVADALHATKGLVSLAAKRLGCGPDTVRGYIKRHPTVAQALYDEREALVDVGELSLYKAVQAGEPWAVALLLRTLGKGRGYVERAEISLVDEAKKLAAELGLSAADLIAEAERIAQAAMQRA